MVQSKIIDNTSQNFTQDFSSDTGFTLTPSGSSQVSGGQSEQLPESYTDEMICVSVVLNGDADRSIGSPNVTFAGGAGLVTIGSTQYLDLTGGNVDASAQYASANADFGSTGTLRFKVVTGYWEAELVENDNMESHVRYLFDFGDQVYTRKVPNEASKAFWELVNT